MDTEQLCGGDELGWVIGDSTPLASIVLVDKAVAGSITMGRHVVARNSHGCVLGVVEGVMAGNVMLGGELTDAELVSKATSSYPDDVRDNTYVKLKVRWLSHVEPLVKGGSAVYPKAPVPPGETVRLAEPRLLREIFAPMSGGWVRIGSVLGTGVEYRIRVKELMKHLAILAVTGAGKSNTVCVLSRRLVRDLNATVVIFDVHGEYSVADWRDTPVNIIKGAVAPPSMSFQEFKELIRLPENAHQQERILRWAWSEVRKLYPKKIGPEEIVNAIIDIIELGADDLSSNSRNRNKDVAVALVSAFKKRLNVEPEKRAPNVDYKSLLSLVAKLSDIDMYAEAIDPTMPIELTSVIKPGYLNIVDLGSLDEQQADAVVSHYIRRIFQERKKWKTSGGSEGYPVPIIVIVEEAHVLIPKDRATLTKYWASALGREGRKFGVGLVIVSQRPKKLDSDVLSQTNNKIVLRMVEPGDIRYIQAASEELSDDIAGMLPSLNKGEAIVMGSMTKLPALVKIDKCDVETGGADIDPLEEWRRYAAEAGGSGLSAAEEALNELL